jgi:4-amino-4-deoxy-L-arabinose transferase-like glycosyltransferase
MKKVLVDLVGFASLIPICLLYRFAERAWGDVYAVLACLVMLAPVSIAWQYFYARVRRIN